MFGHSPPETSPTPQWYLDEHLFLVDVTAEPLAELQPDMPPKTAPFAPILFGAIHGVVSISLEGRFVGGCRGAGGG